MPVGQKASPFGSSVPGARWKGRWPGRSTASPPPQEGSLGPGCPFPWASCGHGSGGPETTPSQSLTAGTEKAVISLVPGQRQLAPAQMLLRSLSLVRAPSSLRCPACGGGHWMPPKAASAPPPPPAHKSDPSAPAFSQQLKGRCINPSRGWKREGNAKGPGAGAKQILPCWLLPTPSPDSLKQALPVPLAGPGPLFQQRDLPGA